MFLKQLKYFFLFLLLTFLFGAQTTYAKTELDLPQNQVSFLIEQSKSFNSLEKELQPNIGFLIEKSRFVVSESVSAQNQHEFSKKDVSLLADAGAKIWDDIIFAGKKGIKEALCCGYKSIDEWIGSQGYTNKVSQDFIKYQNRGGKLYLTKYTNKHEVITRNRMKGAIAEETFLDLEKGLKPDFAIQTSDGPRYIDNLLNGTARELKSGKITVTNSFKRQIRKDLEIIKRQLDDDVIKIEWHALDGIDDAALTFIRNEMTTAGVAVDKFKIVIY